MAWSCCGRPVPERCLPTPDGCRRTDHTDRRFVRDGIPEYRFPPHLASLVNPLPEAVLRQETVELPPESARPVANILLGPASLYREVSKGDLGAAPAPLPAARLLELPRPGKRPGDRREVRCSHLLDHDTEGYKKVKTVSVKVLRVAAAEPDC